MKKAEPQHNHAQNQPAQKQGGGAALESPQGEQLAQLEAMVESSPQIGKLAQLAAMANTSPQASAQRRMMGMIHNSPRMAAQRKAMDAIHTSPHLTAQRQQLDTLTAETAQREETEEPLQPKVAQRAEAPAKPNASTKLSTGDTGLPDNLKSGIESLSGMSMDNVKVHYNSSQPAQLNALAYAQGTDIHVAPGQEQHLPHEAWHVVQQAQGRVRPTMQMTGAAINDDVGLEAEADVMGTKAASVGVAQGKSIESDPIGSALAASMSSVAQLYKVGYAPNLVGLTVPGGGADAYDYDTFNRPADWYENTLDQLFARAVNAGRSRTVEVVPGTNITLVQCESAGSWHNINDMQIGHIQNWRDYVRDAEPATVREATNAYNDLDNLRLEGATPNASHDFEAGRDSEDEDDTDGDMSDDDFIDKSDGGVMPPEARVLLDEYKAGQSSYYKK